MPKPVLEPLKPHQEEALDIMSSELGMLIEYGTGTGKTRIMAEFIHMLLTGGEAPILVLTPNSVLEQTYEEFAYWIGEKWAERNVRLVDSRYDIYKRREQLKRAREPILLLSIEALSYPLIKEGLQSRMWAAILVDEASRFRNYSKRVVTLRSLQKRSVSRYAFTGNLTVRNPADCWYITNWLRPGIWGTNDRKTFITKYFMLGGFTGVEPTGVRPEMSIEFFATLDSLRVQCQLGDIRNMPERRMVIRRTNMGKDQSEAYEQMRRTLKVEIERLNDVTYRSQATTYATRLLRLQEIAAGFTRNTDGEVIYFHNPKTQEMIEALLDDPTVPTIIWYWFRPEANIIKAQLAKHGLKYVWFGDKGARQAFMSGQVPIFLSQTAKGGFGLNLTVAERMEYHTLLWDLDGYSQSQERNRRLNTQTPSMGYQQIGHNIVRNSCEEYVRERLVGKANMSKQFSRSQALEMLR